MKLLKKGQAMDGLQGFIMTIVIVGVVLGIGLIVLGEFKDAAIDGGNIFNSSHYCNAQILNDTNCTGSTFEIPEAYTATHSIGEKMGNIPTWIGIIVTVSLAFIVLGYFYFRK